MSSFEVPPEVRGKPIVVLDANAWRLEWALASKAGEGLLLRLRHEGGRIVVPETVWTELEAKLIRERDSADRALIGLGDLARKFDVQRALRDRMSVAEPVRLTLSLDVVRRAIDRGCRRQAPASENKEEFRDCVLWESVRALAEHGLLVSFITSDSDFLEPRKQKSKEGYRSPKRSLVNECEELRRVSSAGSISIYDGLAEYLQADADLEFDRNDVVSQIIRHVVPLNSVVLSGEELWIGTDLEFHLNGPFALAGETEWLFGFNGYWDAFSDPEFYSAPGVMFMRGYAVYSTASKSVTDAQVVEQSGG